MKKPSTEFIIGAIVFTLIAAGYLTSYQFYAECTNKINGLEYQNQFILAKHLVLHTNLTKLGSALEELKTANRRKIKKIVSKIDGITGEIQNWKKEYDAFLSNINESIDNLTKVDLGKVEVEKRDKQ